MLLAGVYIRRELVLELAHQLQRAYLKDTALMLLEAADAPDETPVALSADDRASLLRVLTGSADELADLRAALLADQVAVR